MGGWLSLLRSHTIFIFIIIHSLLFIRVAFHFDILTSAGAVAGIIDIRQTGIMCVMDGKRCCSPFRRQKIIFIRSFTVMLLDFIPVVSLVVGTEFHQCFLSGINHCCDCPLQLRSLVRVINVLKIGSIQATMQTNRILCDDELMMTMMRITESVWVAPHIYISKIPISKIYRNLNCKHRLKFVQTESARQPSDTRHGHILLYTFVICMFWWILMELK